MVNRISFTTVADGDVLSQGYFNNITKWTTVPALLNHVRTLIDRAGVYGGDTNDIWGEAYVDADGRNNSVDTGDTIATFDTNKYKSSIINNTGTNSTSATHGTWSDVDDAFDENTGTSATILSGTQSGGVSIIHTLGRTFTEQNVGSIYIKNTVNIGGTPSGGTSFWKIQTYDGSTWNDVSGTETTITSTGDNVIDETININSTCQGVRFYVIHVISSNHALNQTFYSLDFNISSDTEIYHTIPTGTFSSTISSAIGTPLVEDWETGASIQYKLQSSGYSVDGTLHDPSSFTDPENFLDGSNTTYATKSTSTGTAYYLGLTFTSRTVRYVKTKFLANTDLASAAIQTYDGSTWTDAVAVPVATGVVESDINTTCEGIRLRITTGGTAPTTRFYSIAYSLIATTEDTGWLSTNEISEFTTFTAEPDTLIVKLIPKTTSPTAGYPSIRGFALKTE